MFYHFLYPLHNLISVFNIFRYISFRSAMSALTAFFICLILGPPLIRKLKDLKIVENTKKDDSARLDELHRDKQDIPTMGGLLILLAVMISTLLWADISNKYIIIVLFVTLWLGLTGFIDDYFKQINRVRDNQHNDNLMETAKAFPVSNGVKKESRGLTAKAKLISQSALGIILGSILLLDPKVNQGLSIPFFKELTMNLGIFYILFVVIVIAGSSNAVNLTDGLDGLAIGIVVMVALAFGVLSYVSGNVNFSEYLFIPYIRDAAELTVFCAAMLGAGLGFLWFNCYPASIFMGDVGSLALGGAIGTVALLIRKELLLVIVGGIFVAEVVSVILQVVTLRIFKKRMFKIAPLHHHYEFQGLSENKIIVRFWIIAGLLALFTIVTLKIR